MGNISIERGMDKIIDEKYPSADDNVRKMLKEKLKDMAVEAQNRGMDVTLQIYDKNTKSLEQVERMNRAPPPVII